MISPHFHTHESHSKAVRPAIALLIPNTLTALGLSGILARMMPHAEIMHFHHFEEMQASLSAGQMFFHYFITAPVLLSHAAFFLQQQHKTIVLVHGDDVRHLPQGFHALNVLQGEQKLVRSFLQLANAAHHKGGSTPEPVQEAQGEPDTACTLTPRERDVLRLLVTGNTNKSIAATLGIELSTVISHRKNITEKMHTKNLAALTIYAVTHGLVKVEEI